MSIFIITALLATSLFSTSVSAQAFDYNKAYADYIFNFDLYQKAHSEYEVAVSQYKSSNTIASETRARETTAAMLSARDVATSTYLTAVRLRLKEQDGITDPKKEGYFSLIDPEVAWYEDHKGTISSAGSLKDLMEDSNEAQAQFRNSELVAYKTLLAISQGKTESFRVRERKNIADLKTKISEIKIAGDKNVDPLERALTEAEEQLTRSVEKETAANTIMAKVKVSEKDKLKFYNDAQSLMSESLSYIKEANSTIKDVILQIKTAD